MKRGQRPWGAIDKDLEKVGSDLSLTKQFRDGKIYLNQIKSETLLNFFKVMLDRSNPKMIVDYLYHIALKMSMSSADEISKISEEFSKMDIWFKFVKNYEQQTEEKEKF